MKKIGTYSKKLLGQSVNKSIAKYIKQDII